MPLIAIPKAAFPNVPQMPGVPVLPRSPGQPVLQTLELQVPVDNSLWQMPPAPAQWGIFSLDGRLLVEADSVLDVGFKLEHKVASYPVQDNAFNSYNKIAEPFQATVRLVKGSQLRSVDSSSPLFGMNDDPATRERGDFLAAIDEACKSLTLYQVVTPERSYLNCNITGYAYRREQNRGAYQIVVELNLQEIRQVEALYAAGYNTSIIKNPKNPAAMPAINTGKVQGQPFSLPPQVVQV